jgi:hypothetical protein
MSYSQSLNASNPGCFIFLLDQSLSMSDPWGNEGSRADQVAQILNDFLLEMIATCDTGSVIKDRIYVSVIGYGLSVGSAFLGVLSGKNNIKISEINTHPIEIQKRIDQKTDGTGKSVDSEVLFPVWIKPKYGGSTPMSKAFSEGLEIAQDWVVNHPNSYPPIIVNITDGEYDSSPADEVNKIKKLSTLDGNVLVFNINIENKDEEIFCPNSKDNLSGYRAELYELSSELPPTMVSMANEKNHKLESGSKGFICNGNSSALMSFLDFTSRAVAR